MPRGVKGPDVQAQPLVTALRAMAGKSLGRWLAVVLGVIRSNVSITHPSLIPSALEGNYIHDYSGKY